MSYNYLFKFILVGDSEVGKSAILIRLIENKYNTYMATTVGVDFGSKILDVSGKKIKLQIWDTAGQETYNSLVRSYYRGITGCLLIFDINKRNTFNNLNKWLNELERFSTNNIVITLVGNKIDKKETREISYEEAQIFAKANNMLYIETSAFNSFNVNQAFYTTANIILDNILRGITTIDEKNGIKIGNTKQFTYEPQINNSKTNFCCFF
jgi:Ras-related protein Rab-2A